MLRSTEWMLVKDIKDKNRHVHRTETLGYYNTKSGKWKQVSGDIIYHYTIKYCMDIGYTHIWRPPEPPPAPVRAEYTSNDAYADDMRRG